MKVEANIGKRLLTATGASSHSNPLVVGSIPTGPTNLKSQVDDREAAAALGRALALAKG